MTIGRFYGGVAALIWSPAPAGYLLLQRAATKDYAAGAWECVTGRVDQGEGYETALRREVREEIGVEVKIDFIIGTSHFYRGPATPEHELLGVVYYCTLDDRDGVRLSDEHAGLRWVTAEEAAALLDDGDPSEAWLRRVIARADRLRALLPPALVDLYHTAGFELDTP